MSIWNRRNPSPRMATVDGEPCWSVADCERYMESLGSIKTIDNFFDAFIDAMGDKRSMLLLAVKFREMFGTGETEDKVYEYLMAGKERYVVVMLGRLLREEPQEHPGP